MRNHNFIIWLVIPVLFSCISTSNSKNRQNLESRQDSANIFIAGAELIEPNKKNYFNIQSSSANIDIFETGKSFNVSGSMFIAGDLYIVGDESEVISNEYYIRACYWKNGEKYVLDPEGKNSRATGITTVGNDVYICGVKIVKNDAIDRGKGYSYRQTIENQTYIVVVWKNGQEFTVKDYTFKLETDNDAYYFSKEPQCNGIYNYKNNFIIAGRVNGKAVYWYNGEEYLISENSYISSTFIDGDNMYFCGHSDTGDEYILKTYDGNETITHRMVAKYWKNGEETALSDGTRDATANDIFVYKNEVYIIGCESIGNAHSLQERYEQISRGKIWKNGLTINDYSPNAASTLLKIRMVDDKIYLLEYIDGECYVNIDNNRNKLNINNGTYYLLHPYDLLIYESDYYVLSNGWFWFNMSSIKTWINGKEQEMTSEPMAYSLNGLFIDNITPYLLYTTLIPRLKMSLNVISNMEENIVGYYVDALNVNANISGLNARVEDIYVYDSSIYLVGSVNNKGRYWVNGNEHELAFKPFKLYVNSDNIWIVGVEDGNIIVCKNDEKTILVRNVDINNLISEIYADGSDLIIILKYYDLQSRKYIFKIFKNRQEIDIYDFQSSGLYVSEVLYRNGTIYSYGVTEGGNYYYSIGNKSYNLLEKRSEMAVNDFDVKHNTVYMTGTYNDFPSLWKNKERQLLSEKKSTPRLIVVK